MAEQKQLSEEEAKKQLRHFFAEMPHPIPLVLFCDPAGKNEPFAEGARQVIRAIRELTDKVTLREYPLDHELAKEWGISRSPTLVFAPEAYKIRWLGAPLGHEAQTFMEALSIIGYQEPGLSKEALKVLAKLDSPRAIKIFVSPTCPYCPLVAVNGIRAAVARPDLITLEIIDILANPDLADKYAAQSVPQAFANEKLVGLGAQPEELFVASLAALEPQRVFIPDSDAEEIACDLVIVGGGPAGLTAGIYASRSGLAAVVVEKGVLGGQVATTPMVENYPGFTQVGGKALVDVMVTHALEYVKIFPGEEVQTIIPGEVFTLTTPRRRYKARAVLLATGAGYKRLGAMGEERLAGRGISYCSNCDGPLFKGKKVIMVGGGDSAVTEALHLDNIGVEVTMVHRRGKLRAQERLLGSLRKSGIPVLFNTELAEILGGTRVEAVRLKNNQTGEESTLPVGGVFIAIGYAPAVKLALSLGAELTPDGYIKKDERHRTTVPGVYSAGDVEGGYKQIVTAVGQGSEAALAIFEDLINPYWIKQKKG
ncbi:MAG: pyridine nucleotide-disulfide oxidoreductase [Deltaproteobacteria bacterium RIFOXYD12_FULL_56_24]|nr:MAG: pyridine nucleotide-disulfide oxidoreductase [Deltaproteobacteria bacterium RIFOXYD12_FULL_56_24]